MLLEFKTSNYKSFKNETVFSMIPAPRQTGLDYSIQSEKIASKKYSALSSAVIYGPNASGKTNLIGAIDTMRAIVLRGNIRNTETFSSPNPAAYILELIPNCSDKACPTSFYIKFVEQKMAFVYTFTVMLGDFLEKDYPRKIVSESLYVNEKLVFERGDKLVVKHSSKFMTYLNSSITNKFQSAIEIAENGLNNDELFLCNGFKTIFSKELASIILNWFDKKFIVIYRSDAVKVMQTFADPKDNAIYITKTLTDAAKEFGITANALGYKIEEGNEAVLCSLIEDKKFAIPADKFESYGTIRFINEFPLVIQALISGATLVMDEFDASIHPMALMNIITVFHNDDININHSQLIFNTHNPIFLNASLFRRDEIKFVERDELTNSSVHYALSDFKTSDGVRKGEDYMSNYFLSRYGAIKDVDFAPILEEIIAKYGVKIDDGKKEAL